MDDDQREPWRHEDGSVPAYMLKEGMDFRLSLQGPLLRVRTKVPWSGPLWVEVLRTRRAFYIEGHRRVWEVLH